LASKMNLAKKKRDQRCLEKKNHLGDQLLDQKKQKKRNLRLFPSKMQM